MNPQVALPHEPPPAAADALAEAVAAWRECGGRHAEPWRVCFVEALLQRTLAQQGEVRRQLEARLRQALAGARVGGATEPAGTSGAESPGPSMSPSTSPLAALRGHIAQAVAARGAPAAAAPELESVRRFRDTWSRLSVEQRVRQAQAKVPSGAGPLNTQRLVHEALAELRRASPAYLHRLMVQVEALLWLDQAAPGAPAAEVGSPAKASPPRAVRTRAERRPARSGSEAPAARPKR